MRANERNPGVAFSTVIKRKYTYTHVYFKLNFCSFHVLWCYGAQHFCLWFLFCPTVPNHLQQMVLVTLVKNKVPQEAVGNHKPNVFCLG